MFFSKSFILVANVFYKNVIERLKKRVCVRPDIANKWMLHDDNVPCHTPLSVTEFWPQKALLWFLSPLHQTSAPVTFSFFLNLKSPQRTSFRHIRKHPKVYNGHAEGYTGWGFPALLTKMGKTSPSVWSCPRELFWRDWLWCLKQSKLW